MLKTIEAVNNVVNNFIWGIPAMICIIGVGLFLSFRTRFIQIRKFPYSIKNTLGRIFDQSEAADGSITPCLLYTSTKNVPWHILAPAAVACDIYLLRRSPHPRGAFFT